MNSLMSHALATTRLKAARLAAAAMGAGLLFVTAASAQDRSVLDRMFGNSGGAQTNGQDVEQELSPDAVVRIERLEGKLRELTGANEELQFRNRQLEQQIRSMGGTPGAAGAVAAVGQPQQALPSQQPMRPPMQPALPPIAEPVQPALPPVAQPGSLLPPAPIPGGRRSDVFDPNQNPNAPGAPHTLGSLSGQSGQIVAPEPTYGAPGGRAAGEPLDLSTLSQSADRGGMGRAAPGPGGGNPLPPPPTRNPNATGAMAAVSPPSDTPNDTYDLAYGYVLRKDYALAEDAFQAFLKKYPSDRRAADAQFWLGESLYQRQRYDAAAAAFLDLSTKHAGHAKAPEALLRLGQSLGAMKQKEMACATLAEVGRKYPRASNVVKQGVEREQKRAHC